MTTRTTILPAGEEAGQMRRHLPPGMTTPARIKGGEEGASLIKDGPRERMAGERKLIKQKTAIGKVPQVSLCPGGAKEGRMKSEHGVMVGMQALLPKVAGRIAKGHRLGMRPAGSPVPGINSTNSSSSHSSSHRHHSQRPRAPGEAHPHHPQATSDPPARAGAVGRSPRPRRMRSPAAGRSPPHSPSVGRWTLMMAPPPGVTPTVTTTRM